MTGSRAMLVVLSMLATNACDRGDTKQDEAASTAKIATAKTDDGKSAAKAGDTKPGDTKPGDTKPGDTKPGDTKSGDTKPGDTKPSDTKPGDTKPSDTKPGDTKPGDTKPGDTKPGDTKPGDTKPGDTKLAGLDTVYPTWDQSGATTVDIIDADFRVTDTLTFETLTADCSTCDGIEGKLDPEHAVFPEDHAVGNPWVLVDAKGVQTTTAASFGVEEGAGETHFLVVLEAPPRKPEHALAYRGPVLSTGAKLVDAKPDKSVPPKIFAAVKSAFAAIEFKPGGDGVFKKNPLLKTPLTKKHVSVFSPRLPAPAKHVVMAVVEFAEPGEPDGGVPYYAAGLFIADADGTLHVVSKPGIGLDAVAVSTFVDLDGDGYDEFVWDSFYYEGGYQQLTQLEGSTITTRTIGGDGA